MVRYGWRDVVQKGRAYTPTGAALRWILLGFCIGFVPGRFFFGPAFFIKHLYGRNPATYLPTVMQTAVVDTLGSIQPFLFGFIIAYFIGRSSKVRMSIADAIGCALVVNAAMGLLQNIFVYIPMPWTYSVLPWPFVQQMKTLAFTVAMSIAYGAVSLLVARAGVRLGEAHRNGNLPLRAKEKAG